MRQFVIGSSLLLAGVIGALGQQKSFVACPIVRDTKTVPCFLAEYQGELYFLGTQQEDVPSPQLKHEVLVEGTVNSGPRVCGGIPIQPISISVLKEVNLSCNTLLPPEPGIEAPPGFKGRMKSGARELLTGPHEFTILYPFDDDSLQTSFDSVISSAAEYAKRSNTSSVKVTGYEATSLLSNGQRLVEKMGLAEKRAKNVATLLRGLGVAKLSVESRNEPEPGDGKADPSRRRVTILVTP